MINEKRKPKTGKSTPLPLDFVKLVVEILSANFDAGLKALAKIKGKAAQFSATGAIHPDEVILSVSVHSDGGLAATTVHASADFDPRASAPTVQDALGLCLDAQGAIFAQLLDPKDQDKLEQVAQETLAALEDVPYDWTAVEVEGKQIWLMVDKSNPPLEKLADEWLAKHDPKHAEREQEEQEEVAKLFVTGDKAKRNPGSMH